MASQSEITVLIPVRNGERFIEQAIRSVLGQRFQNWRLIIADNASTDRTRDIVRGFLCDPRISLMESALNLGMQGNFNRCLDAIASPYYMVLCHDDLLWSPEALLKARSILEREPAVSAVYCDLQYVSASGAPMFSRRFHREGLIDSTTLAKQSVLQTRNLFGIPLLVRTAELNGLRYDPSLALAIDLDLSIAIAKGRPVYHIPAPLIANRYHGGNETRRLLRGVAGEMLAIARKHGIKLSAREKALVRASGLLTWFGRYVFLLYAESRSSSFNSKQTKR